MYTRPPPSASQLKMAVSIKLHTEATDSDVGVSSVKDNFSGLHCNGKTKIPNLEDHNLNHEASLLGELTTR